MVFQLFSDDGHYWVPLTRNQPDAEYHTSLAYEDKLLLRLRIERLRRRPPSQHPESWSQHVLQAPEIESHDGDMLGHAHGVLLCRGTWRCDADADRRGWHHLVGQDGSLLIRLKRVNLLNCDAALPSIQLFCRGPAFIRWSHRLS